MIQWKLGVGWRDGGGGAKLSVSLQEPSTTFQLWDEERLAGKENRGKRKRERMREGEEGREGWSTEEAKWRYETQATVAICNSTTSSSHSREPHSSTAGCSTCPRPSHRFAFELMMGLGCFRIRGSSLGLCYQPPSPHSLFAITTHHVMSPIPDQKPC